MWNTPHVRTPKIEISFGFNTWCLKVMHFAPSYSMYKQLFCNPFCGLQQTMSRHAIQINAIICTRYSCFSCEAEIENFYTTMWGLPSLSMFCNCRTCAQIAQGRRSEEPRVDKKTEQNREENYWRLQSTVCIDFAFTCKRHNGQADGLRS